MLKAPLREIEPLTAQAVRLPLASAMLFLTPWARGAGAALRRPGDGRRARLLLLSLITAVSSVLFVASIKYAGVAIGAVLSSTAPLFALVLGVIFLGERVSAWTVAGALVAVAGIVVLQL
jgi:transporter family protein